MNQRLISNLKQIKKILKIAFWGLFIVYLTFKLNNLTNDKILDILFLILL
ncbi:hypothetical protein L21SP5_03653 [Salinivirga cyanobacteriivorans]|uniref:Uncharacterized protein n=1 Tax=Salinivirga cyanobacteriivorans TaxID=1307839 RepID=A0A0S2I4H5_9BACT|nr:hypothetical protein L21SP5_03653 [Salinivirga cyanobacteriivorans]